MGPGGMVHPRHDALLAHPGGQLVSNSVCSQSFSARAANFGPNRPRLDISIRLSTELDSTRLESGRTATATLTDRRVCVVSQLPHLILVAVVCTVLLLGVACRRRSLLLCDTFRFLFHSPLASSSANQAPNQTSSRPHDTAGLRSFLVLVLLTDPAPVKAASSLRAVTQFVPRDLQLLGVPLHQNLPQHFRSLLDAGIASALMDNATKLASFMYVACQNNIAPHLPSIPPLSTPSTVRRPHRFRHSDRSEIEGRG